MRISKLDKAIGNLPGKIKQKFSIGQAVRVYQGSGNFFECVVVSFDNISRNSVGYFGNYELKITGGYTGLGEPAKVGEIRTFLHSNVCL